MGQIDLTPTPAMYMKLLAMIAGRSECREDREWAALEYHKYCLKYGWEEE